MARSIGKKVIRRLLRMMTRPLRSRFLRQFLLARAGAGVIIKGGDVVPFGSPNTTSSAAGRTLNIVAHEDDDLLFLSPDLLHAIQAGRAVATIFLSAGAAGKCATDW